MSSVETTRTSREIAADFDELLYGCELTEGPISKEVEEQLVAFRNEVVAALIDECGSLDEYWEVHDRVTTHYEEGQELESFDRDALFMAVEKLHRRYLRLVQR